MPFSVVTIVTAKLPYRRRQWTLPLRFCCGYHSVSKFVEKVAMICEKFHACVVSLVSNYFHRLSATHLYVMGYSTYRHWSIVLQKYFKKYDLNMILFFILGALWICGGMCYGPHIKMRGGHRHGNNY